jgi:hypothetical protein
MLSFCVKNVVLFVVMDVNVRFGLLFDSLLYFICRFVQNVIIANGVGADPMNYQNTMQEYLQQLQRDDNS